MRMHWDDMERDESERKITLVQCNDKGCSTSKDIETQCGAMEWNVHIRTVL